MTARDRDVAALRAELHRFGLERDRLRAALSRTLETTPRELDALEHLEADGPLTQNELGRRLVLSSGGVTVLVDRLERSGLVERTRHPDDRRAVLVRLSSAVERRIPAPLAAYHEAVAGLGADLSPDALHEVVELLRRLRAAAAAAADELAARGPKSG